MVFSSMPFLYLLFPLTFLAYFILPFRPWRNGVLLVASLIFYSWGEPKLVALMLAAALVAYLGGLAIDRASRAGRAGLKKAACTATVILLAGNLFTFKYLNFVADNLELLLGVKLSLPAIALPIGISFYTFQILSYVIDLYRGKVGIQRNFFYLALYVSFFPQLIAGPIVRYETVEHEIRERKENLADAAAGARRFTVGLAKKVLLANAMAPIAEIIYAGPPQTYGTALYWVAALAYTFQIYFDFSGYSDMAIGLGRIFGFHFLENFDYPYISRSVTEFWRRWHISLSSWFRDYIYIPLGGNRVSRGRWIFNLFVVWGLTGLWHGAGWNFLLWGLYYAVLLVLEKLLLGRLLEKLPAFVRWLYTFIIVMVGWVIFNRTDFGQMAAALSQMFLYRPTDWLGATVADTELLRAVYLLPLGFVCMLPITKWVRPPDNGLTRAAANLICLVLAGACICAIISSAYNPFSISDSEPLRREKGL